MSNQSIIKGYYRWEKETPDAPFLRQPFGDKWEVYTWKEACGMARRIAAGLLSLGLREKAHIGLVSKNCREWIIADMAIQMAGYVSVPFYPTLTSDQLAEVLKLGDVDALFVGKMEVWDEMKKGVPDGLPLIAFPHYQGNSKVTEGFQWHDWLEKFAPWQGERALDPDSIWTIVFTSGTTGTPKGVVLKNEIDYPLEELLQKTNLLKISLTGDNVFFSYLPLNHIAERVIVENNCLKYGGTISFVENLDTFARNLQDTRPTVFFAVPRIWTKFQLGILAKMPQQKLDRLLRIPIVSGLVKSRIRKGLGLDRCRVQVTGAAPMPNEQKEWYRKIGIPISEGYGMTENCAVCTFITPDVIKPGSVGKAQYGSEIRIDGETGEILYKAPWNMAEYYNSPEKTAETLREGWLHTGDQGYLDDNGFLFITGRVKDTFKTSKGKFIVPAPLEFKFESNQDIEQICITGLGCPQPIALIFPSEIGLAKSSDQLKASLEKTLQEVNDALPNYQRISTIVITKEAWDVENGLLTPTLKVKRNKLYDRYRDLLVGWHELPENIVFE